MILSKKKILCASLIILAILNITIATSFANVVNETKEVTTTPPKELGEKYRIGYAETDPYSEFAAKLYAIVRGLANYGWIKNIETFPYKSGQVDTKVMWDWLASSENSPYIEFVPDAYYCLINEGPDIKEEIIERLNEQKDLDLVIANGTMPGVMLANDRHNTPILVISSSNAIESGIVESETDSGLDHIWAHLDLDRARRQLEVFHDMFKYKKLGMVYENTEIGRTYAAVNDVESLAKEKDFDIIREFVTEPKQDEDRTRYLKDLSRAFAKLAPQIDAMFLSYGPWKVEDLPELLQPFYEHKVPVYSLSGKMEVEYGALMSVASAEYRDLGFFGANAIIKVLKGTLPRNVSQVYPETPSISINLEVAEKIDYQVPFEILLIADKIYVKTKTVLNRGA